MIGVFAFDGPMYCDKNGVYCNTTISTEMLSRYLSIVDKLVIIIRTFHLDKTYQEAKLKKVENPNFVFLEMPNFNSPKTFFKKGFWYKKLRKIIKDSDLFFLRLPSIISNMVAELCKKEKKPYMVEVGGCAWDSYWNHSFLGKLCAPYMYFKEKRTVKEASYVSYVTEKWLQNRYPCNCEWIAASNVYLNASNEEVLEKRLEKIRTKDKEECYRIGTTAAVNVRYKGQEYVIQALSELKKKGYYFEYQLVGGGEQSYLKKIAKKYGVSEQVQFKGLLLPEEVFTWLDELDFYIQPSKQEGLPRALIEAMSRGCPALGATTAGIPELLEEDVVFKSEDVKRIARILEKMTKEDLLLRAERNFQRAKDFELPLLNERRNIYYHKYRKEVLGE